MDIIEIMDDQPDNASDASDDRSVTLDYSPPGNLARDVIDLTDDPEFSIDDADYLSDSGYERLLLGWGFHEIRDPIANPRGQDANPQRQVEPLRRRRLKDEVCVDCVVYRKGQSLQLSRGKYLRICSIIQYPDGQIYFQGRNMIKTHRHSKSYVPKCGRWENELLWIENDDENEISLTEVRKVVTIHFTNSCDVTNNPYQGLTCRLKERLNESKTLKDSQGSIQYISAHEADDGYRWAPKDLRSRWRGETRAFGEADRFTAKFAQGAVDDLTGSGGAGENRISRLKRTRWYSFGDGFCGAGGVSCGANQAGLEIKWAFDASHHAARSYQLNFENAACELGTIDFFLTNEDQFQRVDVSHGSPPCQTFSPAHTMAGRNDDANSACIFSCSNLIRTAKPRVHTMEETSGLWNRHTATFNRVILDFVEMGYSVRWGILFCADYGVPQLRKRLVIMASGPGEVLPMFPKPTHGPRELGLKPLVTVNQAIARIPRGAPDHNLEKASAGWVPKVPYDGDGQVNTITCGGGDRNYHPSGRRRFTNREFACLQTFPRGFRFGPVETLKQIGNAVPPALARVLYAEIIRSLQQTDETEMRELEKERESEV